MMSLKSIVGLLAVVVILLSGAAVKAGPPIDPLQCGRVGSGGGVNCSVASTYSVWPDRRTQCRAAVALFPSTEEELLEAVRIAVAQRRKVKVVSRWVGSMPPLVCPGGGDEGMLISTRNYNRRIIIDRSRMTVTADSGVLLRQLVDTVAEAGLALPYTPYWAGVSVGGVLATGAHGSSFFDKGGAVHEYVVQVRVLAYHGSTVRVTSFGGSGPASHENTSSTTINELDAFRVSLGSLGVISTVTFQLQPLFKRSVTVEERNDTDLEQVLLSFGGAFEFADIVWHASQRSALFRMDRRVSVHTPGDGLNDFLGFQPQPAVTLRIARRTETNWERAHNLNGKCIMARAQNNLLLSQGLGLKNNGTRFEGYPVIGYQNRIQTADACLRDREEGLYCAWDARPPGLLFHQTTVYIAATKIQSFIEDVKALRDMEEPGSMCGVDFYYGFYMRYVKGSTAFLGQQEDAVSVDITYYRADDATTPRLKQGLLEEIEQMAIVKYEGRPHWAKNRPVAFQGVWRKYPNLDKFLQVKRKYDPLDLFSSEWSDAILGIDANSPLLYSTHDGCALEGLCICSQDSHCAPHDFYFCRPGLVYTQARVCRRILPTNPNHFAQAYS